MNAGRQRQPRGSRTLSAAEMLRLGTWAVDIAAEVRGEARPRADGSYRVGANHALLNYPGSDFHDFSTDKHDYDPSNTCMTALGPKPSSMMGAV